MWLRSWGNPVGSGVCWLCTRVARPSRFWALIGHDGAVKTATVSGPKPAFFPHSLPRVWFSNRRIRSASAIPARSSPTGCFTCPISLSKSRSFTNAFSVSTPVRAKPKPPVAEFPANITRAFAKQQPESNCNQTRNPHQDRDRHPFGRTEAKPEAQHPRPSRDDHENNLQQALALFLQIDYSPERVSG